MKKLILFFLITCCSSNGLFSQAISDAGLWATFNVEKKMSKRLEVFLTQGYRLKENYTQTSLFYTGVGASYKPLGFMKISVSYRATQKARLDESYSFRHRLTMDVLLKKKFGKLSTSFRQRIQTQVNNVYSSETGQLPAWYAREKVEVGYDLDKPIKPFASVELRYQFNNPRDMELNGTWNRVRYSAGLDYKINETNAFSLYYMIQRGFNVPEPQHLYIIGLAYTLSL